MKEDIEAIGKIEDKHGTVMFRMGLSHLVDVGHRNLSNDEVEAAITQITAQGKQDKANGVTAVMTPEFQCEVIRCAAELARFSIWALFAYIKERVVVSY